MDFRVGDIVCVIPKNRVFVWEHNPPGCAAKTSWLELEAQHKCFGIYLRCSPNKTHFYVIIQDKCYLLWNVDFDFERTVKKNKIC